MTLSAASLNKDLLKRFSRDSLEALSLNNLPLNNLRQKLPLLFTFLLPPQVQLHEWNWLKDSKELRTQKARRIDKISDRAFLHRWASLSSDNTRVQWPDPDTGKWMSVNAWTGGESREWGSWKLEDLTEPKNPDHIRIAGLNFKIEGPNSEQMSLQDPQRPKQNVWTMILEGKSFNWKSDGVLYLSALDRSSNLFYWMNPRSFKKITKWQWDEQAELVDLLMCAGREMMLVENISDKGLSRVVNFRDGNPVWYTVFDFSNGKNQTTVSQVLSRNCRDIFFTTTVGMYHVSY